MSRIKAKHVVFLGIGVMMAYVMYHNERFLIQPSNPAWEHYLKFKWWLLPHGIFGAIVLLFAPFQFSGRLRRRYTRTHRIMGRMYVVGAFGLAPLGAYIQYFQEGMGFPRSFTVLAVTDAAMLMITTAVAFLFAYKRKIVQHRQWVTRSYSVALVFITGRFVMGVTGWEQLGVEIVQAITGRVSRCRSFSPILPTIGWKCAALYQHKHDRASRRYRNYPRLLLKQPRLRAVPASRRVWKADQDNRACNANLGILFAATRIQ